MHRGAYGFQHSCAREKALENKMKHLENIFEKDSSTPNSHASREVLPHAIFEANGNYREKL